MLSINFSPFNKNNAHITNLIYILFILCLTQTNQAQITGYLEELNQTSIMINQCTIDGVLDEACIEKISKQSVNLTYNHLLFSRIAANFYFDDKIDKAYKYALLSEKSENFNEHDFSMVFEIYRNLGHYNYIKTKLLPKFKIKSYTDRLEYGYYLYRIQEDSLAYKYIEENYDFNKDLGVFFHAKPYLERLWLKNPRKAVLLCELYLREEQESLIITSDRSYSFYDPGSEANDRKNIHSLYILKALSHSMLDEYVTATQCLNKADEYKPYDSSSYIYFICDIFFNPYSKNSGLPKSKIKSLLPKKLVTELNSCY